MCMSEEQRRMEELHREAWEDQMRADAIEAQAEQDAELERIFGDNDYE